MNKDQTLINHLWWLRKFANNYFGNQEYKEIYDKPLDIDTIQEINQLVAHINANY